MRVIFKCEFLGCYTKPKQIYLQILHLSLIVYETTRDIYKILEKY